MILHLTHTISKFNLSAFTKNVHPLKLNVWIQFLNHFVEKSHTNIALLNIKKLKIEDESIFQYTFKIHPSIASLNQPEKQLKYP